MSGSAWTVRPGRPEDTASILELFQATFGSPMSAATYRWRFMESPCPLEASPTFVSAVEDRIVGHIGGTPLRLRLGQRELPAVHACNAMVATEFGRQGIMSTLFRTANEAWATAGAPLQLGLPTRDFVGLRQRLDYRPTISLGWLWRPLWRTLERRPPRSVDVTEVETPGPEFDELWDAVRGHYEALVVRDRAWVAYRYAAAPAFVYRILLARVGNRPVGYLVYRVMADTRRSAWIADLLTAPDDRATRAALVRAACARLRRDGASDIRIFAARGTPLARHLIQAGFLPRRGAYDVRAVELAPGIPWDVLRDPRRFLLMGGDFDVV